MPTEAADSMSPWLSPTPKDVVRERVRARTRSVLKVRLLTGVTAVLVVALAISLRLGGDESSSRIVTVDTPAPVQRHSVSAPAEPGEGVSVRSALADGLSPLAPPDPALGGGEQGLEVSGSEGAGVAPVDWDYVDPVGDARYHQRCALETCPEQANDGIAKESQPAIDIVGVDAECSATTMRIAYGVLDLTAPLAPSQIGKKAIVIYYTSSVAFASGKRLTFILYHDLERDSWRATVHRQDGPVADVPLHVTGTLLAFEFSTDFFGVDPAQEGKAQLFGSTSVIFDGPEPFTRTTFADGWETPPAALSLC